MFGLSRRTVTALATAVAFLIAAPSSPAASPVEPTKVPTRWGCYPGMAESVCAQPYVTTVLGNTQLQRRRVLGTTRTDVPGDPPIDCFYVYPTVTGDGIYSNAQRRINSDVRTVLRQQAAAFTPACRVFAPIYRQESAGSIAGTYVTQQRGPTPPQDIAYADVLGAWNEYMANDNHGRGVLLIGHSQGSAILSRLLRDVIDPNPVARAQLVGAILPGGAFTTARGQLVGGTTQNIPLCRAQGQVGCVVAYSTYGRRPGRDPLFAALGALVRAFGGPTGSEYELACTNPAELAGDGDMLHPLLSGRPAPGWSGVIERGFWNFLRPEASTQWVTTTDKWTASCDREPGTAVLRVRAGRNSIMPSPVPWAEWGLHSGEVALTLGTLVELAHGMGVAYVGAHGATSATG